MFVGEVVPLNMVDVYMCDVCDFGDAVKQYELAVLELSDTPIFQGSSLIWDGLRVIMEGFAIMGFDVVVPIELQISGYLPFSKVSLLMELVGNRCFVTGGPKYCILEKEIAHHLF